MDPDLTGQVAFIAGSTGGIGEAIARTFADHGADVIVNGRTRETGEALARDIEGQTGVRALFAQADMNDYEELTGAVQEGIDELGPIDISVCSGGASSGPRPNFFRETDPGDFQRMCQTRLVSRLNCMKAVLEPMIEAGGGRMINIGSDAGRVPTPGESINGAAYAGLVLATRALANEFSRWDITVNTVSISVTVGTDALQDVLDDPHVSKVFKKALEKQQFTVTPQEVAETVLFLAGNERSLPITGQTISVNGGISFP